MAVLTGFGFATFFIVTAVVGTRLILLWRRTRQLPELLIACGVLGIGTVGFGFAIFALLLQGPWPIGSRLCWALALFSMNLGAATTYLFTCYVFRRSAGWARVLTAASALFLAWAWIAEGLQGGFHFDSAHGFWFFSAAWVRIGALVWASIESLLYWQSLRKRVALGLGDPVIRNRMLLWAVGIGAAGWGTLTGTVAEQLLGIVTMEDPRWMLSSSLHGLAAAVAMWLAFMPPRRFTQWTLDRHARKNAA